MKKYALFSLSDKTNVETLAMALEKQGYTILSTSNTALAPEEVLQSSGGSVGRHRF